MFYEKYQKEIIPKFKEKYGFTNSMMVPKIEKVLVGVGINRTLSEKNSDYIKWLKESLRQITGQEPVTTLAKKSISNFKIREGLPVGLKVTLRRKRMYDFLDKLINIVLSRTRDFRGISPKSIDKQGNLSLGFREQIIFPEINAAEAPCVHGLRVSIVTNARDKKRAKDFFDLCGLPFSSKEK
ncbi:50S ribosomal protein L5 [bacterium (Candidatus Moisslbacteria) CG12_big_fil_rev_8_21_14_0_65_36_11]|nr:50S ribosomal protein L5 [Candidatus Kuenenbacteria bacterium]OIP76324.1 MAG: 50S ribosomal protein L5 [Parcubacteria group bacterium CG2_30_36_38]PIV45999.1 MAG: 50S ribosomal protein L5 [bacterium (Candidatus Moisslbacteria) CG02_land_8_20_14_3_00_36_53]PIW67819.1 MAG: 50S ribosomal protein L5 [bacterium (Candidatus Moisslbacteria) CG12_big_fil_rev_8_21_14_0_65_36_11]PIZ90472.1 MAG: 50S ribosomal protein L5 [bacterium (Candidatus Moisslbacteria) CG_4_10_14_0_2_um_filter_36_61]PJC00899.1 M